MPVMRSIAIAALIISFFFNFSSAQRYALSPDDTLILKGNMEDMETLTIEQINTSTDTIKLKWKKINSSVPEKWEASVCDNMICHTNLADTGTMLSLAPGEKGFLLLHITPHVNYGTSVIRYLVWDADFPASIDTLTYILNVENASAVKETGQKNFFCVFPLPANDQLNINTNLVNGFSYSIVDISGKILLSGSSIISATTLHTGNLGNNRQRTPTIIFKH